MIYLQERRRELGGPVPTRGVRCEPLPMIADDVFEEFQQGSNGRDISTTMAFVRVLSKLLKDKQIGRLIVPIVPDEGRTFGMESLFRQIGIYSHAGQLYEPVDADTLLYYHEAKDGQLLEEGITEAGSMCSFIAAGTAHATHGINTIPFFVFYSMFGLQRIGDLIWAAGDMRARGFLIGGTAGRTTLNGEGLQHQDGNSHLLAYPVPNLKAYDPAYAYELAVIIRDGIRRMYVDQEDLFYYVTVENEPYPMPAMPEGSEEGILRGMYRYRTSSQSNTDLRAQLFGSGAILNEALRAQQILGEHYNVAADVWSITSFKELHTDGTACDRWNRLHSDKDHRKPWIRQCLNDTDGVYVVATDYVKALPYSIGKWFPKPPVALGTDGYGRSESRPTLRRFFEVDAAHIVVAALGALAGEGKLDREIVSSAMSEFDIDPEAPNPVTV
jgi:pyruvate dehydrogenase E1 component